MTHNAGQSVNNNSTFFKTKLQIASQDNNGHKEYSNGDNRLKIQQTDKKYNIVNY